VVTRWRYFGAAIWVGLAGILPIALFAAPPPPPDLKLDISLRLDKSEFEVGEAIPLTVEIINHSETEYAVQTSTEETGALDGLVFAVADLTGKALPIPRTLPKAGNWIGAWYTIKRHDKHERKLFLNYWMMPPDPGRYRVQGAYNAQFNGTVDKGQRLVVRSAAIEFEIIPTTATKLDVRISRLSDQAEKGDALAVDFLGFTGVWQATDPLLEALYHEDQAIRRRAANALNFLPDPKAVLDACLAKLKTRGPNETLAEWLHFQGAPATALLPVYLRNVDAEDPVTRAGAVAGLRFCRDTTEAKGKYHNAIRAAVMEVLSDRDTRVRLEALQTLAADEDAQAAAALLAVTRKDSTARVRRQAALCLNDMRAEAVIPYLRELLLADYRLRPNFAAQLREIGSPQARGVLRDGLKSANAQVRAECAKQLWLLKDAAGKQTLVEVLRTGSAESQTDVVRFLEDVARAQPNNASRAADSTARTWADWLEKQQ
jgi:HEAT repeat protein